MPPIATTGLRVRQRAPAEHLHSAHSTTPGRPCAHVCLVIHGSAVMLLNTQLAVVRLFGRVDTVWTVALKLVWRLLAEWTRCGPLHLVCYNTVDRGDICIRSAVQRLERARCTGCPHASTCGTIEPLGLGLWWTTAVAVSLRPSLGAPRLGHPLLWMRPRLQASQKLAARRKPPTNASHVANCIKPTAARCPPAAEAPRPHIHVAGSTAYPIADVLPAACIIHSLTDWMCDPTPCQLAQVLDSFLVLRVAASANEYELDGFPVLGTPLKHLHGVVLLGAEL
ncbi:hypothetical protein GGX14DRAFT_675111 [Mycena pura]|uniref:Uncharacterized protein n=1 Tax=Mycena pura TaxID=153505 RepID=A0AAD6YGN0_9AGAR|nr:hypothetical protein GGX14DRAFT_675111 [Mycena pura]